MALPVLLWVAGLAVCMCQAEGRACTSGFVSDEAFQTAFELRSSDPIPLAVNSNANQLTVYPSMTFNCSGVITGVRAALPSRNNRPASTRQDIFVVIVLLRASAVVDLIVLRTANLTQLTSGAGGTIVWRTNEKLHTEVQSGDYIGLSIPRDNADGQGVYYQGVASPALGAIRGKSYTVEYNSLSELESRIREVTAGDDLSHFLQQPFLQFSFEPVTTPVNATPHPTPASPQAPSATATTTTLTETGGVNAGLIAGLVVGLFSIAAIAIAAVVLQVIMKCKDSNQQVTPAKFPAPSSNKIPFLFNPIYESVEVKNASTFRADSPLSLQTDPSSPATPTDSSPLQTEPSSFDA